MNPLLFSNSSSDSQNTNVPAAITTNKAGGKAYALSSASALAKLACSGVLENTYHATAEEQLDRALALCDQVAPEFIAKLAIYSRQNGSQKDLPVALTCYLAHKDVQLAKKIFSRVVNNPKVLRKFVEMMRSGKFGSKSLGTASKKLVQNYLNKLSDEQLINASVGQKPTLKDIIRMVHPKPESKEREALYAYLLDKDIKEVDGKSPLCNLALTYEVFKKGEVKEIPNVDFRLLTACNLTPEQWKQIACNMTFTQTKINLNTLKRHGVFEDPEMVKMVADRIANPELVRRSGIRPYELMMAFMNVEESMPQAIHNALQQAMEIATEQTPEIAGKTYIAVDVSGSMTHKVNGAKGKTRFLDVAALFAASFVRRNKEAEIIIFDTDVRQMNINPFDSIMTNAQKLSSIRGGGTDCSKPAAWLANTKKKVDTLVMISDNESWRAYAGGKWSGTGLMEEWHKVKQNNPNAKLVNVDIAPTSTTQTANVPNTLLVSGFSDAVMGVIAGFVRENEPEYWSKVIDEIRL